MDRNTRGGFGTNLGFVLAAVGSAVGLGNIWKFPYIAGVNGGGAFVLVYLGCVALVGLPLMYAELVIGKRGGRSVIGALRALTSHHRFGPEISAATGFLALMSSFLILAYYLVVAGWTIHFVMLGLGGGPAAGGAADAFARVSENPWLSGGWSTLFMILVVGVVARGVHGGIERVCRFLMPALIALLVGLCIYVGFAGGLGDSATFLFRPDFAALDGAALNVALGHAFFTLSLGMGAMITYGSYLGGERHIVRDSLVIVVLDTVIAVLAGLVIFAAVFSGNGEPGTGRGLLFVTLPDMFAQMPGGRIVYLAFFIAVFFAAWSSGIALLEVVVAWCVDELGMGRHAASVLMGGACWVLGIASAISPTVFAFCNNASSLYLLPVGGLLVALLAGWLIPRIDRDSGFAALAGGGKLLSSTWTKLIRYVVPWLVLAVLL